LRTAPQALDSHDAPDQTPHGLHGHAELECTARLYRCWATTSR